MLFKLAVRNVRRQVGSYLIYFITVVLTVATVFAVNNMIFSDVVTALQGMMADFVRPLLVMLSVALAAIMAFVLAYATTFLLRRRKKEFGLYLTLGFSRGNILSLFAGETALTFLVSLAAGSLLVRVTGVVDRREQGLGLIGCEGTLLNARDLAVPSHLSLFATHPRAPHAGRDTFHAVQDSIRNQPGGVAANGHPTGALHVPRKRRAGEKDAPLTPPGRRR